MLILALSFTSLAQSYELVNTDQLTVQLDTYLRTDLVTFKNVVDLDRRNHDDQVTYYGLDYSFAFSADFKNSGNKIYLKVERNGPYDYSAPLFVHNTLVTSGGSIEGYRNQELLPQVEEFWLDNKFWGDFGLKTGLYIYAVGNGFSLNGGYENYGVTLYRQAENSFGRLYYCRPDLVYKNRLGPHVQQEEDQGEEYETNAANFFAADIKISAGPQTFWPYVGVLADYTSAGKRDNFYAALVKRDLLGTFGVAWEYAAESFTFKLEAARNFGYAQSQNSDYKDIQHTGYLVYSGINYVLGKFIPELHFLFCSGNNATLDLAGKSDEPYVSGKNRAFSYSSVTNRNLSDTVSSSNVDMLPIVAMGGGYGLNYGVPRPGTFSSADFDNLILPVIGFTYNFTDKLCLSLYGYYLRAASRPVGRLNGQGRYLARELGTEADLFIDYQITKNINLGFLGGCFFPGKYYKEERDDYDGSIFSPYVRGDGRADNAYQLEFYVELKF